MSNHRRQVTRIRLLSGFIFLLGLLLICRLYYVQIVLADYYHDKAEGQYVHTNNNLYSRGTIYFSTKEGELVSAASIKTGFSLAINPSQITDAEAVYQALAPFIIYDKDLFLERARKTELVNVVIEANLDNEVAEKIDALKIKGVLLYRNQWRYYPGGDVSSRSIGFTGFTESSPNIKSGIYGLERFYDETLKRDNSVLSVNFFAEIFSNLGNLVFNSKQEKRGDIVTTIEPTVARMLDRVLLDTQNLYHSDHTGGIIINPKTGEIYAMNSIPTYNLNDRAHVTIEQFQNPLVENVYEMGSIIKALSMASGLDSGVVTPKSTYYDAGFLELDGYTIRNYDGRGRGTVDMQEVLNQSLNTGVSFVASKMGKEKFRDYFLNLKLGSETGIDLPNEAQGLVNNLQSPRQVEYATASFGQGIAMTPIATTRALATLGNGGYLVTPHLVKKVVYDNGTEKDINYPKGNQVFSNETSETITRMLVTVVDDALRGGTVALPNYTVAAKTGTAQIANPAGGYYSDRYLHSFFGYFPAYDPQFLVFLYTVEPKNVKYASETLTAPFMEITKFLINYYNVPPDRGS